MKIEIRVPDRFLTFHVNMEYIPLVGDFIELENTLHEDNEPRFYNRKIKSVSHKMKYTREGAIQKVVILTLEYKRPSGPRKRPQHSN